MFKKEKQCILTPEEVEKKSTARLKKMTLREKIWLLNGKWDPVMNMIRYRTPYNPVPIPTQGLAGLRIPPLKFSDGPRGVVMGRSTCFPVSMARGASFDRELEARIGDVIGKETRAQGANLFAGVCLNLLRHPAWGRAQETYGEDPYHVGEMGKALLESVQNHNVMACAKHYALNNIENSRFFVNVKVDRRALHEVYLPQFKKAVDAGAACLMGSYNRVEGEQACESKLLLTEILRDEWGFEGFTISDFIFGVRDGIKAITAGLDVEMPMPLQYKQNLLYAVREGRLPESVVDRAVLRLIKTQLVFSKCPDPIAYPKKLVAHPDHRALAREAAEKSMVLIKNQANLLPFPKNVRKILVLGRLAAQGNTGDHGSSRVNPAYVITPLQGLKSYLGKQVEILHRVESQLAEARQLAAQVDCVVIVAGYDFNDEGEFVTAGTPTEFLNTIAGGYHNLGQGLKAMLLKWSTQIMSKQISKANGSPVGGDRASLSLKPEQIQMIQDIARINPNTVVALVCGSMVMLDEWADQVPAILYSWYAGMEGGHALARILFGDVNPSGKLPFSIPTDVQHLPYFSSTDPEITYDLYHGYTLLDKNNHQPAYPFGFGLGYTSFQFQNGAIQRLEQTLEVSVLVTNTGERDGEEVVQVYAGMDYSRIERQKKLLKGFKKVFIRAGETISVNILISLDDLRYYNQAAKRWILERGTYTFMVGPSSAAFSQLKIWYSLG